MGSIDRYIFRTTLASFALVLVSLTGVIWITTSGGYFWPIWPMMGWGIGLASHALATFNRAPGPAAGV